jgi:hypothetical protein
MKKILLFVFIVLFMQVKSQVAINTDGSTPDASAILDLKSSNMGFLVPRLSSIQKANISQPATGLLIYQTDGAPGFYYNQGTPQNPSWTILASSSTTSLWIKSSANSTILANPNDSVGIGRPVPVERLDINGNLALDNF